MGGCNFSQFQAWTVPVGAYAASLVCPFSNNLLWSNATPVQSRLRAGDNWRWRGDTGVNPNGEKQGNVRAVVVVAVLLDSARGSTLVRGQSRVWNRHDKHDNDLVSCRAGLMATGWDIFKRNRTAQVAGWVLVVLYTCSLFAEIVAPYGPFDTQDRGSLLPPTQIYWRSPQTGTFLGPHVYPTFQGKVDMATGERQLTVDYERPAKLRMFVKGPGYRWLGIVPGNRHLFGTVSDSDDPAAPFNVLGTDDQGRDYFSRLVFGSRVSLFVGIVGVAISFPIGLLVGGIAGYLSGWVDTMLMRLVEVLLSIPSLYLLVSLAAVFQENPLTGVPENPRTARNAKYIVQPVCALSPEPMANTVHTLQPPP